MSEKENKKKFSGLSENASEESNSGENTEKDFDPNKLSDEVEAETYTPITGNPVNEKDYSNPYEKNAEVIPEPTFEIPTFEQAQEQAESKAEKPKSTLSNPQIEQATPEEKVQGAEILADAILDGYEKLHELAQWYVSVDEEELMEKAMDDKIDLTMQIPADEDGTEIPLKEFVSNFNEQSKEALQLDPSFKEKVRAPMIRVFIKRGWGLSDEQYLGYMFGRDIVEKTSIMVGLKRSMGRTMRMLEKTYAKIKTVQNNINQPQDENQYQGNHGQPNPSEEEVHYTTVAEPEETQFKGDSNLSETGTIVEAEEVTD